MRNIFTDADRARVAKVVNDYIIRRVKWQDERVKRLTIIEQDRRMKAMG